MYKIKIFNIDKKIIDFNNLIDGFNCSFKTTEERINLVSNSNNQNTD